MCTTWKDTSNETTIVKTFHKPGIDVNNSSVYLRYNQKLRLLGTNLSFCCIWQRIYVNKLNNTKPNHLIRLKLMQRKQAKRCHSINTRMSLQQQILSPEIMSSCEQIALNVDIVVLYHMLSNLRTIALSLSLSLRTIKMPDCQFRGSPFASGFTFFF